MNSLGHLAIGFLAAFAAALAASSLQVTQALALITGANAFAVIALGSLFPDVDHRKTKVFKTTLIVSGIAGAFLAYNTLDNIVKETAVKTIAAVACGALVGAAVYVLKPRHRGITHSLLAAAVFAALVFLLFQSKTLALFAFVAYALHLIADGEVKLR